MNLLVYHSNCINLSINKLLLLYCCKARVCVLFYQNHLELDKHSFICNLTCQSCVGPNISGLYKVYTKENYYL
jgi:hypothetical protein